MTDLRAKDLLELSEGQMRALASLQNAEKQEDLGGSFEVSVAEWKAAQPHKI